MRGLAAASRTLYAAAARVFSSVGDDFGLAYASCGQGNALRLLGRYREARRFMEAAIRRYKKLGLFGPLGFVLWSRAQLNLLESRFRDAAADLNASERCFRQARDPRGLVYVLLARAQWAHRQQRSASALNRRALRDAIRLHLKLESVHARYALGRANSKDYARLGVVPNAYLRHSTLP